MFSMTQLSFLSCLVLLAGLVSADKVASADGASHGLRRLGKGKGKGKGAVVSKSGGGKKGGKKGGSYYKGGKSGGKSGGKKGGKQGATYYKGGYDDNYVDDYFDDGYFDDFFADCFGILDSTWTHTFSEDSPIVEIDVDQDGANTPGDLTVVDAAALDVTLVDLATTLPGDFSMSGTCTTSQSEETDYCLLTFDFGENGVLTAQGPFANMNIVGSSGCFPPSGTISGFFDVDTIAFTASTGLLFI